jgi:hypothetical protein
MELIIVEILTLQLHKELKYIEFFQNEGHFKDILKLDLLERDLKNSQIYSLNLELLIKLN